MGTLLPVPLGGVNYTANIGRPLFDRIEPTDPPDPFFRKSTRKHLEKYGEVWEYWGKVKTDAKKNLDAIEDAYKDYEAILADKIKAAKITLFTAERAETTPYYKPRSFRIILLQNLRQKVVFGKVVAEPLCERDGERFKVNWDGEIIAGGQESQCKALANLGAELLKSDDLGNIVRRISQAIATHENFVLATTEKLRNMLNEQIVDDVTLGFKKLKGKCDYKGC